MGDVRKCVKYLLTVTSILTGLVATSAGAAPGTLLWQQNLSGTAINSADEAVSVTVDNRGDVVAAGFTANTGTPFADFTVAKFAR